MAITLAVRRILAKKPISPTSSPARSSAKGSESPVRRTASAPCSTMNRASEGSPCATSISPRTRSRRTIAPSVFRRCSRLKFRNRARSSDPLSQANVASGLFIDIILPSGGLDREPFGTCRRFGVTGRVGWPSGGSPLYRCRCFLSATVPPIPSTDPSQHELLRFVLESEGIELEFGKGSFTNWWDVLDVGSRLPARFTVELSVPRYRAASATLLGTHAIDQARSPGQADDADRRQVRPERTVRPRRSTSPAPIHFLQVGRES